MICEISRDEYREFRVKQGEDFFLQNENIIPAIKTVQGGSSRVDVRLLAYCRDIENEGKKHICATGISMVRKIFGGYRLDMFSGVISQDEDSGLEFYRELVEYSKCNKIIQLVIKPNIIAGVYDSLGNLVENRNEKFELRMREMGYQREYKVDSLEGNPDWQYKKKIQVNKDEISGDRGSCNIGAVDCSTFSFNPEGEAFSALLKSVNGNCKRKVKKALDLGIFVEEADYVELPEFQTITSETAERNSFADKPLSYYEEFYRGFRGQVKFLNGKIDFHRSKEIISEKIDAIPADNVKQKPRRDALIRDLDSLKELESISGKSVETVANAVVVYGDSEVIYFLGGSRTDFQSLGGSFLLQLAIMTEASEAGYRTYNFFGIEGVFDGKDGVLRFKQNFNGYIEKNLGAYSFHPYPIRWKMISLIKKIVGR